VLPVENDAFGMVSQTEKLSRRNLSKYTLYCQE